MINFYSGTKFDKSHETYEYAKKLAQNSKILVYHFEGDRQKKNIIYYYNFSFKKNLPTKLQQKPTKRELTNSVLSDVGVDVIDCKKNKQLEKEQLKG